MWTKYTPLLNCLISSLETQGVSVIIIDEGCSSNIPNVYIKVSTVSLSCVPKECLQWILWNDRPGRTYWKWFSVRNCDTTAMLNLIIMANASAVNLVNLRHLFPEPSYLTLWQHCIWIPAVWSFCNHAYWAWACLSSVHFIALYLSLTLVNWNQFVINVKNLTVPTWKSNLSLTASNLVLS